MKTCDNHQGTLPELKQEDIVDGRYRIVQLIGKGGMGDVYLAEDVTQHQNGRQCALKVGRQPDTASLNATKALDRIREKRPNVIRTTGIGYDKALGLHYSTMEYVDGISLSKICRRLFCFTEKECLVIAFELCGILKYLEALGILHGDIKPSNILLDDHGALWLADLGIARELPRTNRIGNVNDSPGVAGQGTPLFVSPEQWLNAPTIDSRSDIFGLGTTLYELSTGRHAFPGENIDNVLKYRMDHTSPPMTPKHANPKLSRGFSRLVMEMMSDAPEERPSEASEVLVRLEALGCLLEEEKRAAILKKLVVRPARKHLPKPRIDIIGIIFKWLPEILLAMVAAFLICRLKGWV